MGSPRYNVSVDLVDPARISTHRGRECGLRGDLSDEIEQSLIRKPESARQLLNQHPTTPNSCYIVGVG